MNENTNNESKTFPALTADNGEPVLAPPAIYPIAALSFRVEVPSRLFWEQDVAMSAAAEQLRQAGFRVDASTGSYRLKRSDGFQAANYDLRGQGSVSGHLGHVSNRNYEQAVERGLAIAQLILKDEAARLALPRPVIGKEGSWRPPIG
jgi:hypothetical protein